MYHHHHHGKNGLFLQGGNGRGDAGLVLSTDAKPRLKWTPELHEHFIEAVNQIGGADSYSKDSYEAHGDSRTYLIPPKEPSPEVQAQQESSWTNYSWQQEWFYNNGGRRQVVGRKWGTYDQYKPWIPDEQISEALQMQIEVQRRLHEQLEVQRHLQLRIEAQGKYLQSVLEKAQETLGRQNLGTVGLEAAKVQLSELASKVSTECLNSAFSGSKELPGLCNQQTQPTDCSIDSCLTSCEGSQKDQEMHNIGMGLGPFRSNTCLGQKEIREESKLEEIDPIWCKDLNENKMFLSSIERDAERMMFPVQRNSSDFSMSIRVPEEKGSSSSISASRPKERDGNDNFHDQINARRAVIQQENEKNTKGSGLPYLKSKLDLNSHDENDTTSGCKQFDLNGFSWS